VVIETVKWSEDGRGLIVRLQESMRQRGDVTLSTAFQE
jgi:alpha-mannosidase